MFPSLPKNKKYLMIFYNHNIVARVIILMSNLIKSLFFVRLGSYSTLPLNKGQCP